MKFAISTLRFLSVLVVAGLLSYFFHEKFILDHMPGRWYLYGSVVSDSTTYTGVCFKVNDTIKLVTEYNCRGFACYVYVREGSEFQRTGIREYWDVIGDKYLMIRELQIRYEKKSNENYKF